MDGKNRGWSLSYNERLFQSRGLRSAYHLERYRWLAREMAGISSPRVIELGCFDAKSLRFIPQPSYYLGLDADWEGGLSEGRKLWRDAGNVELVNCVHPSQIPDRGTFDIGVVLETLEHLPDPLLDEYIAKLGALIHGKLFVSVPRERGLIFLAKYLAKTLFYGGYAGGGRPTPRDVFMLTLSRTNQVKRCDHKGFDERVLIKKLSKYFRIEKVSSIFPRFAPLSLSVTVGIVARSDFKTGYRGLP